jgi:hypothetical protein
MARVWTRVRYLTRGLVIARPVALVADIYSRYRVIADYRLHVLYVDEWCSGQSDRVDIGLRWPRPLLSSWSGNLRINGSIRVPGRWRSHPSTPVHAKVCKHTALSAAFVCRFSLYASERAAPGYWYLAGSHVSKRLYQRLSYAVNMLVPVRCSFDKL